MSREQMTTVNISSLSFAKVLIVLAVIGFLYIIRDIIGIVFAALLFSSMLSPWVSAMEKRRIPRRLGVLLIYLSVLAVISLALVLLAPPLVREYNELVLVFPHYSERFVQIVQGFNPQLDVGAYVRQIMQSMQSSIVQFAGSIFLKIFNVIVSAFAVAVVFVLTFYMVAEEAVIKKAVHSLTPQKYHSAIDELTVRIQRKIGLWLRGQLLLCFFVFILVFLGLVLLHVDYALILAIFVGLTEFIPVLGPMIGSLPAIFIAFNQDPPLALFVVLLYFLVQRVENDFLVPTVMRKAIGISPLISIIALLIGGKLGGIVGILLAIPVVTVLSVILEYFFEEENHT